MRTLNELILKVNCLFCFVFLCSRSSIIISNLSSLAIPANIVVCAICCHRAVWCCIGSHSQTHTIYTLHHVLLHTHNTADAMRPQIFIPPFRSTSLSRCSLPVNNLNTRATSHTHTHTRTSDIATASTIIWKVSFSPARRVAVCMCEWADLGRFKIS